MFFAQRLQIADNRLPKFTGCNGRLNIRSRIHRSGGHQLHHSGRIFHFGRSGSRFFLFLRFFFLRLFCFSRSRISGFCYSGKLERNFGRRKATLVITSSIFQIPFYLISPACEFYFLNKLRSILKVAHFHFKQLVESSHFLTNRLQFTGKLQSTLLIDIECRRNRSAISKFGRINMPSVINGGGKYNLRFGIRKSVQLGLELYRIFNLCLQSIANKA